MTKYGENYKMTQEELDVLATYMDDEIREKVHNEMMDRESHHPCTPEEFLVEYIKHDPDFESMLKSEFSIEL